MHEVCVGICHGINRRERQWMDGCWHIHSLLYTHACRHGRYIHISHVDISSLRFFIYIYLWRWCACDMRILSLLFTYLPSIDLIRAYEKKKHFACFMDFWHTYVPPCHRATQTHIVIVYYYDYFIYFVILWTTMNIMYLISIYEMIPLFLEHILHMPIE